jgi:hypothetical protein
MDTLLVDANMRMESCQRDVASSSEFKKIPERLRTGKSLDPACAACGVGETLKVTSCDNEQYHVTVDFQQKKVTMCPQC